MTNLVHIADRVLNRPLLITPDKAEVIMSVLSGRIGINSPDASRFEGQDSTLNADGERKWHPYKNANGVGVISVTGSLVNRGAWIGANSGLTSYEGVQHQIKSAAADPNIHSIILDLHSPGGEATGAFETADIVRQAAGQKPVVAIVNGMAASAAYAIASGANEIVTTETGVSGSIGVVLLHADFSQKLKADGVKPTMIFAGAHKVDGNPFEPLSDSVRADLQTEVNAFYDLFLQTVAQGRGNRLDAAAARKTEARTFIGQAAVAAGIADRVGSFETVLSDLQGARGRATSQPRSQSMSENTGVPAADSNAGISQADHTKAVADARKAAHGEGVAEGLKEGKVAGAAAERERLSAIIGAEGIAGNAARMVAALELANESPEMAAEKVVAFTVKNVAEGGSSAALSERGNQPDSLGLAAGDQAQQTNADDSWGDVVAKVNKEFSTQH